MGSHDKRQRRGSELSFPYGASFRFPWLRPGPEWPPEQTGTKLLKTPSGGFPGTPWGQPRGSRYGWIIGSSTP
jgi:hypothetical protein